MKTIINDYIGLCHAMQSKKRQINILLKPYNITPEQLVILLQLQSDVVCSQNSIALHTNKDKGNVSRIVQRMIKSGLLQRKQDSLRSLLCLTDKATDLLSQLNNSGNNVQ